jgi:UDP:flavonoid glycosyltransferase YjiC (YdhE family)
VKSLSGCEGILCNAGFETPAETLYLGKKMMVVPMRRQYEQQCNAEALERMGIPVVRDLGNGFENRLCDWINSNFLYNANYKNNLPLIVERILDCSSKADALNDYIPEPDFNKNAAGGGD